MSVYRVSALARCRMSYTGIFRTLLLLVLLAARLVQYVAELAIVSFSSLLLPVMSVLSALLCLSTVLVSSADKAPQQ